jgi:hypothetical protein
VLPPERDSPDWQSGLRCLRVDPGPDGGRPVWVHRSDQRWKNRCGEEREKARRTRTPEAQARSDRESARRTVKKARWYAKGHRLNRLATLTFKDACRSWDRAWDCWNGLERLLLRWRSDFVAIVFVEPHPGGELHGWHLHAIFNQYVHWRHLLSMWRAVAEAQGYGGGGVDIRSGGRTKDGRTLPKLSPGSAAAYVSKYVAKTADPEYVAQVGVVGRRLGQHRYRCANGTHPVVERRTFATPELAVAWLGAQLGRGVKVRAFSIGDGVVTGWRVAWPEDAWDPPPPTLAQLDQLRRIA